MKYLFIFLIFPLVGYSQLLPTDDKGAIKYQEIIEVPGKSHDLKTAALKWAGQNYRSLPDVLKLDVDNQIVIKGLFTIPNALSTANIEHTITIDFKDNKARVTVDNLYFIPPSRVRMNMNRMNKSSYKGICKKVDAEIVSTIQSIEDALNSPIAKNDDW